VDADPAAAVEFDANAVEFSLSPQSGALSLGEEPVQLGNVVPV
jgi:hypothetical protein